MLNWYYKIIRWYYNLYKFDMSYKVDKEAMVAVIGVNKPRRHITQDEQAGVDKLEAFFVLAGYCVIVRD